MASRDRKGGGRTGSDVVLAHRAALPAHDTPARVFLVPPGQKGRAVLHALEDRNLGCERNPVIAANVGFADQTGGQDHGNHGWAWFTSSCCAGWRWQYAITVPAVDDRLPAIHMQSSYNPRIAWAGGQIYFLGRFPWD